MDVVVDNLGGEYIAKGIDALRGGGIIVAVGFVAGLEVTFNIRDFFFGQKQLRGALAADIDELRTGLDFVRDGKIKPVLDRALPLSEAAEAPPACLNQPGHWQRRVVALGRMNRF